MKIFEKYLLIFLVILLPSQFGIHFWPNWAYVFGLRIDFLAPAIYISDILVFLLLIMNLSLFKKYLKYLVPITLFAIINTLFSVSALESVYRWSKLFECLFLAFYIKDQKIIDNERFIKILTVSGAFVSILGVLQFIQGKTLGGLFYFFGERSFNMSTPGIALVNLNGIEHLRAYSTFSHPNSLAGYLSVLLILSTGLRYKRNKYYLILVSILLAGFILTFSLSAYIGLLITIIFIVFRQNKPLYKKAIFIFFTVAIMFSLFLPVTSTWILESSGWLNTNITQRLELALIAGQIISTHFLTGHGLGTFIVSVPLYRESWSFLWLLQPVHNIFLLSFAETGILGLLSICLLFYKQLTNLLKSDKYYMSASLVFIIFTGLFDHYWLTLQQNQMLLILLIGFAL